MPMGAQDGRHACVRRPGSRLFTARALVKDVFYGELGLRMRRSVSK